MSLPRIETMTTQTLSPPEVKISLAVGAAVLIQSALALIWAGSAAERLNSLERRASLNEEIILRTVRLEEQLDGVRVSLARIEKKLDDTNH